MTSVVVARRKILVQVSVTEPELSKVFQTLTESLLNLKHHPGTNISFLVVVQSGAGALVPTFSGVEDIEIVSTTMLSVSHARNVGIDYAQANDFQGIIFHDASITYAKNFLDMAAKAFAAEPGHIPVSTIRWEGAKTCGRLVASKRRKADALRYGYVWSYIFPLEKIADLRFMIGLGPGQDTELKCGEDVIFMDQFFERNRIRWVTVEDCEVTHPARPKDLSKQLAYALGQGAVYRYLLERQPFALRRWLGLLLFILNGIRFATFSGEKGRRILVDRLRGLKRTGF